MNDTLYRVFMIELFKGLNPIFINRKQKILSELSDVSQVIYVMKGRYRIGYEVNKNESLKMQLTKGSMIGGYECSYDRRSIYIYRAHTDIEGYFITKRCWKQLEQGHPELFKNIRRKTLMHFANVIHKNLEMLKEKDIEHFDKRSDYKQVLVLRDYDKDELAKIILSEFPDEKVGLFTKIDKDVSVVVDQKTQNAQDLRAFKKKFKNNSVDHLRVLKGFGEEYDASCQLNHLIDEENRAVRSYNEKLARAL